MKMIEIGNRVIGPGFPCFIVAEAGVNHNGDIEMAKRLIIEARNAGADAVKFQTWITEKLVIPDAKMAEYQKQNLGAEYSQFDMLKQYELTYDQFKELKNFALEQKILFFSTPDEEDSADFLYELNVPCFKIGSGEVTNLPLLRHVALKNIPIILSTGMSDLGEVETAVRVIEKAGNRQLILLHCESSYPSDPSNSNLRAMDTLAVAFGYLVGFSDHTMGIEVAIGAVARGACVIEKHLTLDKSLKGPDHCSSLEPDEFTKMVRSIRLIENALGDGIKRPTLAELETKNVVQKTIVTARDIAADTILTDSDLTLRRASKGLSSFYLPLLLGRRVNCDLKVNTIVTWEMLG